jgi:hypothetical protein
VVNRLWPLYGRARCRSMRMRRPTGTWSSASGLLIVRRAAAVLVRLPASVRKVGRCRKIFVPQLQCTLCRMNYALLPSFVPAWQLDEAKTSG